MPGARTYRLNIAAALILLSAAAVARGEDQNPPPPKALPALSEQTIYKGVVGNLLEQVPIEPEKRVQLQRGNAVVSNALSGRSLAVFLGIASPPLMIVGLLWGLWAASQIGVQPAAAAAAPSSKLDVQAKREDLQDGTAAAAAAPSSKLDLQAKRQDLQDGTGAAASRKDDEALDTLVAELRMLTESNETGGRYDSLCSTNGAADCERLADLVQPLPEKRFTGRSADQARGEAAHAQIDSGMTDRREMPLLEVVLEQSPIR